MRAAGVEVEYQKFSGIGHGYGVGIGTQAEGWISDAIDFWKRISHSLTKHRKSNHQQTETINKRRMGGGRLGK